LKIMINFIHFAFAFPNWNVKRRGKEKQKKNQFQQNIQKAEKFGKTNRIFMIIKWLSYLYFTNATQFYKRQKEKEEKKKPT
jgi:hypothetical protein